MFKRRLKLRIRKLQLYLQYYSFLPTSKSNTRYLVIMLNNVIMHGGLLDRLKGIITTSVVADALGYELKIYVDKKSFSLFKFIVPVNFAVVANDDEMVYNAWGAEPVLVYNLMSITKEELLNLFRKKKQQYHFYCNLNLVKLFYPGETQEALDAIWRNTFNRFFTFDPYFENYARDIYSDAKHICGIHLRFVSLLGDFEEAGKTILPDDEKNALVNRCSKRVFEIFEMQRSEKYLVVSDSVYLLNALREALHNTEYVKNVFIPGGRVAHIDLDHSDEMLQRAVLDFYLLSKCNIVYQVLASNMYNSQFCRYAAVLGNATYVIDKI